MTPTNKSLKEAGFANVTYPAELRSAVMNAEMAWRDFCALPKEIRKMFPYDPGTGMGVGYELKERKGTSLDLKENFHWTLGKKAWLRKTAEEIGNPTILAFIEAAEALVDVFAPHAIAFAGQMERGFGMEAFKSDIAAGKENWYFRFLHYFPGSKMGDEIATAHADKSGTTWHLYESHPGLQRFTHDGVWVDMPVSETETAIIPGMRGQYRSKGDLLATYHRVVANAETAVEGRYSMVCFVHPANTPEYNKGGMGRLQEMPAGFNYKMSFEEFAKLFV